MPRLDPDRQVLFGDALDRARDYLAKCNASTPTAVIHERVAVAHGWLRLAELLLHEHQVLSER